MGLAHDPLEREADAAARAITTAAAVPPRVQDPSERPALSRAELDFFEPRLGHDFSRVRIFEDASAQRSADAIGARAYSMGDDIVLGAGVPPPGTVQWQQLLAHELTHIVQARRAPGDQVARRISFGTDGTLSPARQSTVRAAAQIAERRVASFDFRQKWNAFWTGPGRSITPQPSLDAYQAAVRARVIHDMDTSADPDVQSILAEDRALPIERQTAGVTKVGSTDTYLRGFAIDQGVDSVVSLLLHESIHGAGVSMGPIMLYEPFLHGFEAQAGFPLFMGGADLVAITQVRRGDYHVEATISYNLRRIDVAPLPDQIEIQVVSPETGDVITQEEENAVRQPVRHRIPSRVGQGSWLWHARYVGWASVTIRIVDMTAANVMASRSFTPDPRCVLGVSSVHCEDE